MKRIVNYQLNLKAIKSPGSSTKGKEETIKFLINHYFVNDVINEDNRFQTNIRNYNKNLDKSGKI